MPGQRSGVDAKGIFHQLGHRDCFGDARDAGVGLLHVMTERRPVGVVTDVIGREVLRQHKQRLHEQAHHRLKLWRDRLATLEARLRLLGPEQVLARGYSITMDAQSGRILREAKAVKEGQRLRTRLKTGEVVSKVEKG